MDQQLVFELDQNIVLLHACFRGRTLGRHIIHHQSGACLESQLRSYGLWRLLG